MPESSEIQALAVAYNNVGALVPLHQASPPLFRVYGEYVNQTWVAQQSFAVSGARRSIPIGLPSVSWLFPSLTISEYSYLRTTYVPNTDALVTIRTFDDEAYSWKNFNAIMFKPQGTFDGKYWNDAIIQFTDLREII